MGYLSNPFLERMSEQATSDHEFVRLFSPKIMERLPDAAFESAVHVFSSSPGGGKTTLLRAFTPPALRAFWNSRRLPDRSEAYQSLAERGIIDDDDGPQLLGVFLSCASGYADLPPGATNVEAGLFRALLDCRVVLRSLRNLLSLLGLNTFAQLGDLELSYNELGNDLKTIPTSSSVSELVQWAEQRERCVYAELDSIVGRHDEAMPSAVRFESVIWLQSVSFSLNGKVIAPKRLLMIDDLHKLRRKQRALLLEELSEMRLTIPIWLAERRIALGDQLLSQGVRSGRDLHSYSLEEIWSSGKGPYQFSAFAQNILDRRLDVQKVIPSGTFSQYLRDELRIDDTRSEVPVGIGKFRAEIERMKQNSRYSEWLTHAEKLLASNTLEALRELYATRVLLVRDESRKQLTLELNPLSTDELAERDNSQVQAAAEIFMHEELNIPYYYGIDRLCTLATSNVEELLGLAAALYDGIQAKQVLRKAELQLSPQEQEKLLREVAKHKRQFIPKNHTEGTRAQRLLDSIGNYCRARTFLPNAPYAPGVTGVRLSFTELDKFNERDEALVAMRALLKRVLFECVAENLLVARPSGASTSREAGTIFYLNRTLCVQYGLPLQMGGWQDVDMEDLIEWMERGGGRTKQQQLEIG
ncbi:MAG: hypothetical protein WCF54_01585 [Terracidiphilus sp.]